MKTNQNFSIYNKFVEEREKYNKLYEKYGKAYDISISYNKNTNSINYISSKGTADEERLSVKYFSDGKIVDVFAYAGVENYKEWSSLTWQLANLGSNRYKRNFDNPFFIVAPPHVSSYKKEGMFDIMMQTTYEYINQTNQNVTLGVSYEGYGYACSPVAKILHGKDAENISLNRYFHRTVIYKPNTLYALEYYNAKLADKEKFTMLFFENENDDMENDDMENYDMEAKAIASKEDYYDKVYYANRTTEQESEQER